MVIRPFTKGAGQPRRQDNGLHLDAPAPRRRGTHGRRPHNVLQRKTICPTNFGFKRQFHRHTNRHGEGFQ